MTPAETKRYCERFGTLTHDGEWKFSRHPDKTCPVVEMTNASLWCLVEKVAEMIKEYN